MEKPVETIRVALDGTRNMLECARRNSGSRLIYLSTMEVYGSPSDGEKIKESHGTDLDTMSVRTSYPESKRMCEALCKAYSSEYGVGVQILRLTQTFGPGVLWTDGRVFAEFARCAVEGRDIVLKTKGLTERCYLYTADAVRSIFTVLLSDRCNDVYNVANEDTYCSIFEMAELVANKIAGGRIRVRVEEDEKAASVYAPTLHMNLDTAKIRELGWKPEKNLLEMFKSMISDMNSGE